VQVKPAAIPRGLCCRRPKPLAHFMAILSGANCSRIFGAKATAAAWSKKASYASDRKAGSYDNPELERFMAGRAKSETIELPGAMPYFFRIPRKLRR